MPAKISDSTKLRVDAEANRLLEEFRPQCVLEPPAEPKFNYIIDLYARWRGRYLTLGATYACPFPNAFSPTFDAPFARLEHVGGDRFHLAYMRHTGKWEPVYFGLPLAEAVETIRSEALFQPC